MSKIWISFEKDEDRNIVAGNSLSRGIEAVVAG